ncbi:MAG: nitrous oxide reductase family maturation protein NosD [Promethearchaeota archaeon]
MVKSKNKIEIVLILFGMILVVSNIRFFDDSNEWNNHTKVNTFFERNSLKNAGFWNNLSFIYIDDNWSAVASYDWCTGDGSFANPYVLENITIDASSSPTGSGIYINNSKNDYFIIRNCTIYNAIGTYSSGIKLENTCNGILVGNNCSNNEYGIIMLNSCENNSISENICNENFPGIYIWKNCNNNTIQGNTCNFDSLGIVITEDCNNNSIRRNIIKDTVGNGISIRYGSNENVISDNIISNELTTDMRRGIYIEYNCCNNEIFKNVVNNVQYHGILISILCHNNSIFENSVQNSGQIGIYVDAVCENNNVTDNYTYFNGLYQISTETFADNNIIKRNIMVSEDYNYIGDFGANNDVEENYQLPTIPSICIDVIGQFSLTNGLIVTLNISSGLGLDPWVQSIEMWWDGVLVPSDNITEIEPALYNISLAPKLNDLDVDLFLLNMTVISANHLEKYFETFLVIKHYEITEMHDAILVEIVNSFYSLEYFNITFSVLNEATLPISITSLQIWWDGTNVSSDIQNIGSGLYLISLESIIIDLDEDPIHLNITISADGYATKYFETYIAVDPDTVSSKGYYPRVTPIEVILLILLLIIGIPGVVLGLLIVLLKKRRTTN